MYDRVTLRKIFDDVDVGERTERKKNVWYVIDGLYDP